MKHDLGPGQTIAPKQVHEQLNWGYDSEGAILIVIRGMEKSHLIASAGPLSWRRGGAEEQEGFDVYIDLWQVCWAVKVAI